MNAANFHEYLTNPSLLYQISQEELKTLIVQYPYSQNLRYLLAQKSQQEQQSDYSQHLRSAAVVSPDRVHLYQLLKELEPVALEQTESLVLEEDALELVDLEMVDFSPVPELVELEPAEVEEEIVLNTFPELLPSVEESPVVEEDTTEEEEEDLFELPSFEEEDLEAEEEPIEIESSILTEELEATFLAPALRFTPKVTSIKQVLKSADLVEEEPTPRTLAAASKKIQTPKSFRRNRYKSPTRFEDLFAEPAPVQEAPVPTPSTDYAAASVAESNDIASETLAELLVSQHQYPKAIEVYHRLKLIFPEKNTFFAEQIQSIKDKIRI